MSTKTRIESDGYSGKKSVTMFDVETVDAVGRIALVLIEKWGFVVGVSDGEDSAGRAKSRDASADEVVTKAFDIAETFWSAARSRGHMLALPDLNEINVEHDAKAAAKEEARRS